LWGEVNVEGWWVVRWGKNGWGGGGGETGKNNIYSVSEVLKNKGIDIKAEAVGGSKRRTLTLDVFSGITYFSEGESGDKILNKPGEEDFIGGEYFRLEKILSEQVPLDIMKDRLNISLKHLEQSNVYSKSITEIIREPFLVLDKELKVKLANPSFCNTFGLNKKDAEGKLLYEINCGKWNIPSLLILLKEILPKKNTIKDYQIEYEFIDSRKQIFMLNAREITNRITEEKTILLVLENITIVRNAEDVINRIYGALLNSEEKEFAANQQLAAGGQQLRAANQQLAAGGQQLRAANQQLAAGGQQLRAANQQLAAGGQQLRATNTQLEKTGEDLINSIQKLKDSEAKYRVLFENIHSAIIVADTETGEILDANINAETLFGRERKELVGMNRAELHPKEQSEYYQKQFLSHVKQGNVLFSEALILKKDGTNVHVHMSATIIDLNGRKVIQGVFQDITEQKNIEKQLLQSQKMESIGNLAGGIAHDFNNLLTVIKGNIYIAQRKMGKESSAVDALDQVSIAVDRAAALTEQMLLFSRQQPMIVINLNMNDIVKNIFKMLSRIIGEDIKIEKKLQNGLWNIKGDKVKLEQILLNLVVNARDAMPSGGEIKIETENVTSGDEILSNIPGDLPGNFVKFSVQDTGIGMSKDIIKHIFEPFFTTKGVGKGTGLGLSVVYGIVNQHKGRININSEPGKGSTFSIYLPATSETKTALKDKNIDVKCLKGKGERILIVEDEPSIRELLQALLTNNGYTVFSSGSALGAIEVFNREKHRFDIVFSDIVLPDRNGLELVKELLSAKPGLKVIFSSGYMDEKSQSEIIKDSGYAFIQKPYELNVLLSVVKEVLSK